MSLVKKSTHNIGYKDFDFDNPKFMLILNTHRFPLKSEKETKVESRKYKKKK